jgi:dCMP deaminase
MDTVSNTMKPKHLDAFMDTAYRFAELSEAVRARVGAIIVKDRRIISIGYNGMPSGWDNCCEDELEDGTLKTKPQVLHAEANAIAKLSQSPESAKDAVLFCTHMPCMECAKLIHQSGIRTVYYGEQYVAAKGSGEEFLSISGITLEWLPPKPKPVQIVEKTVEKIVEKTVELEHPTLFAHGKLLPPDYLYVLNNRTDARGKIFTASVFRKIAFLNVGARYNWDNLYNDIRAVHNLFEIDDWVIDYSYEAHIMQAFDHSKGTVFNAIHKTILQVNEEFGINFDQFHLIHGNYFIKNVYDTWRSTNNIAETLSSIENSPTLFFHNYFVSTLEQYKPVEFLRNLTNDSSKHYCTFNGRSAYDRVELLKFLHRENLLEKGYSTWHFDPESWEIIRSEGLGIERINRLPEGDLTPSDFSEVTVEWGNRKEQEVIDAYDRSAFEIVVETITNVEQESYNWDCKPLGRPAVDWILKAIPEANTVFFTEKTARPLLWGMPFFLHAGQYALQSLRELGFQTFDSLWDESYDLIYDPEARAAALHASIKEVLSRPISELDQLIRDNVYILEHNQQRFRELAELRPKYLWVEMYNAKSLGHTDRTILTQLKEPNGHIRIK